MNQTLFLRVGLGIFSALLCYVIWRIVKLLWDVVKRGYQLRHIPGPPPTSLLLGNPVGAKDFIHRKFPEYVKKYGKIFKMRIGHKWIVVVEEPEVIKDILGFQGLEKAPMAYNIIKDFVGEGLLTSSGETWRKSRTAMEQAFHRQYMKGKIHDEINSVIHSAIQELKEKHTNEPLDMLYYTVRIALDIIGVAGFGIEFDSIKKEDQPLPSAVKLCLEQVMYNIKNPLRQFASVDPAYKEARGMLQQTAMQAIQMRRKQIEQGMETPRDILDILVRASMEESSEAFLTEDVIIGEFMTFLVAGHETTANMVAWAILNLCQHPEKLKKLQEEVDRVLGNEQVEYIPTDELNELKYTQNCLKESLRLVSVAPGTARTTGATERQVGPYLLPPDQLITVSSYCLHRMEEFWPEPESFLPERWDAPSDRPANTYMPFSIGPRNCIGQQFAMIEGKIMLAQIIHNFAIELQPEAKMHITQNITLRPTHPGVPVKLIPRR